MAGVVFTIKRGDTKPRFRAQCRGKVYDANGTLIGTPGPDGLVGVPLVTAVSAKLLMAGNTNGVVLSLPVVIEDQTGNDGWLHRDWLSADTAVDGIYKGEIEVRFSDGSVQTFPGEGAITIVVTPDLG